MAEPSGQLASNGFGLDFHHLGLAVRDPATARTYLKHLGYVAGACEFDPLQNVHLGMFHHPQMPDVEVIWPGESPGPIDALVRQREGLVYHVCYVAADVPASLAAMKAAGLRVLPVARAKPAVLFGGTEVSFYNVLNVGLIEFIHGAPENGGDL